MKWNESKGLRVFTYVVFAAFALFVSIYLTFPGAAVAQRMSYEIAKGSNGAVSATVGSASLAFPLGLSASDVELEISRDSGEPVRTRLDELVASLDVLPLFMLQTKARVRVELDDGTVEFAVVPKKTATGVEAQIVDLNLLRPPLLPSLAGMPVSGMVSGGGDLMLAKNPKESSGTFELTIDGLGFGPGDVVGFSIPESIALGKLHLSLEAKNGTLAVSKFEQVGGQLALDLSGALRLSPNFTSSSLDGCVKFKFSDEAFLKKYPKFETAMQLAGARFKKGGEGFMHVPLKGVLAKPTGGSGISAGRGLCRAGRGGPRPARR